MGNPITLVMAQRVLCGTVSKRTLAANAASRPQPSVLHNPNIHSMTIDLMKLSPTSRSVPKAWLQIALSVELVVLSYRICIGISTRQSAKSNAFSRSVPAASRLHERQWAGL
jgi:hypothetical protein